MNAPKSGSGKTCDIGVAENDEVARDVLCRGFGYPAVRPQEQADSHAFSHPRRHFYCLGRCHTHLPCLSKLLAINQPVHTGTRKRRFDSQKVAIGVKDSAPPLSALSSSPEDSTNSLALPGTEL